MTINALIVQPDGTFEAIDTDPHFTALKEHVGGWLEAVAGVGTEWVAYGDEDGRLKSLPVNEPATLLVKRLLPDYPTFLVGPILFCGLRFKSEEDGYTEADVPAAIRELAEELLDADH